MDLDQARKSSSPSSRSKRRSNGSSASANDSKKARKSASKSSGKSAKSAAKSEVEEQSDSADQVMQHITDLLNDDGGHVGELAFDYDIIEMTPGAEEVVDALANSRGRASSSLLQLVLNSTKTVSALTDSSQGIDKIFSKSATLADYSATIASASEELSSTIQSISNNLDNTVQASNEAREFAAEGDAVIDSTLMQIQAAHTSMEDTNDALTSLLDTAEQANTIIQVVNDISSKTDLLALNASIEAARAGAAGKGFAVVAHEVGRLSEKTQNSIAEIESIIKNIKSSITQLSMRIESGTTSANAALTEVTKAKSTISGIVERIENVDREVANIGSAVREQGHAVADIATNINTISSSSTEVNAGIELLSTGTDKIARLSNDSRNALGKFDLGPVALIHNAKIDHLFWMHRLRRMIEGKEVIRNEEFTDHHGCRLGKWYDQLDASEYGGEFGRIFNRLAEPHAELHRLAADVIRRSNIGDAEGAYDTYQRCIPVSIAIMDNLDALITHL